MALLRRARGVLFRVLRRRGLAVAVGLLLLAPAIWLQTAGSRESAWCFDGLSLIAGATGVAFLWVGVAGVGPDWIE